MSEREVADVCIIGAGLVGGLIASELSKKGVQVVILETGQRYPLGDRFQMMKDWLDHYEYPWKTVESRDLFVNKGEIAYEVNRRRVKAVGGSSLAWEGTVPRLVEVDFRMHSAYGVGADWPITYEEIEPYYQRAEEVMGISGADDNPWASRRSAPFPLPPFPFSYSDKLWMKACKKVGIPVHHVPQCRNLVPYRGRPQCASFATCYPICPIRAKWSADVAVEDAERTGHTRVIDGATVRRLELDAGGRVSGATYSMQDGSLHSQVARTYVLASHAIEAARLLLLSACNSFPDGLANESGLVGKYFMEHLHVSTSGQVEQNVFPYRIAFRTARSDKFVIPDGRGDLSRFTIEFSNSEGPKPVDLATRSDKWGMALKKEVRESFGHHLEIASLIEMLPVAANTVTLDNTARDQFGDPAPCLTFSLTEHDRVAIESARSVQRQLFDALGATRVTHLPVSFGFHNIGTTRMGDDPKASVVDRQLRAHGIENLFVVGSGCFPTGGVVNPSATVGALAIRAADYLWSMRREL